jgi:hypothetical protein
MDKNISGQIKNPITRELSKSSFKKIDSLDNISDSSSSSGSGGNLFTFRDEKENNYYAKKVEDNSHLAFQEYLAGTLYRMMGANVAKQKLVISSESTIFTGSKEIASDGMSFKPVSSFETMVKVNHFESKSIALSNSSEAMERAEQICKLMAGAFCIGESDRNPRNYYLSYNDEDRKAGKRNWILGKFDHDQSFQNPMSVWGGGSSTSPALLAHVNFIEKISGSPYNALAEEGDGFRYYDQPSKLRLYNQDKEFNVHLNLNFFDDEKINSFMQKKGDAFLFVSFLQSVQNYINMPTKVKDFIFDPQKISPEYFSHLSEDQQEETLKHAKELRKIFDERTEEISKLIKLPLERLKELESQLIKDNYKIPNCHVDYGDLLEQIQFAEKEKKTLRQLKVDSTNNLNSLDQKNSSDTSQKREKEENARTLKTTKGENEKIESMTHFINQFKPGDILYGVSKTRWEYLDKLMEMGKVNYENLPIIDRFNNKVIHPKNGLYKGNEQTLQEDARKHFEFLEKHPYYDPKLVPELSDQYKTRREEFISTRDYRINRSCKGGILSVMDSKDARIHFLLKDFDPIKAFHKEGERGLEGKVHFTNSEFRLIYRIWRQTPEVVDHKIIFWDKEGQKIMATDYFKSIEKNHHYEPKHEKSTKKLEDWAKGIKNRDEKTRDKGI